MPLLYLTEGSRIFYTSLKTRIHPKKYAGKATDICQAVVKDCWNGRFFQTSTTNFPQFWTRDFGWCTKSLLTLKYTKEVQQTLRYALNRFKEHRTITTTITPGGTPFDFPVPAVDSLPWFIHSLNLAKFPYYAHKDFLNKEIRKFYEHFINPHTGLVKPELSVSSIKDLAIRKSSCYDNCMVALLAKDIKAMKLYNPFAEYDYPNLIKRHFWDETFFYDDLSKQEYVAGDANIFPFVLGIISDKEMMQSALKEIQGAGLDQPFPLKYTNGQWNIRFVREEFFLRGYEADSLWTHMGPLYIKLVQQLDKELAQEYHRQYTEWIEREGNYLEVFFPSGKPYHSPFYYCDRGMLWACNYLTL